MATIADIYALAVRHHQAGQLAPAEQLYRQILQTDPNHADSHHLLGVLDYQRGRHDQAVRAIRHALSLNPSASGYYCNLGLVYRAQGKVEEAAIAYQHVLRLDPHSAEAYCVLGNLLTNLGRLDEAVEHCRQALRIQPGFAGAHNNLGLALNKQDKLDEAVTQFQIAVQIDPAYAAAHTNLAQACNLLGIKRIQEGRLDEATSCFECSLRSKPDQLDGHFNLGSALMELGRFDEAMACFHKALQLKPDDAEVTYSLGNAYLCKNQMEDAIRTYQQALRLQPTNAAAANNLGSAYKRLGQYDQALDHFDQALAMKPQFAQAHWNRAVVLLLQGKFQLGWPEYEWRWTQPWMSGKSEVGSRILDATLSAPRLASRTSNAPAWDCAALNGRTILLTAEQGLGDTIHFIRFAPLVKQRGGRVIVQCQPSLLPLLAGVAGVDQLVSRDSSLPHFDVQAPLASLPRILGTSLESVPATIPYLHAKNEFVAYWKKSLPSFVANASGLLFLVGIAWQGNPAFIDDWQRSMPLAKFVPLAELPEVRLISLQKGPGVEQAADSDAPLPFTANRPLSTPDAPFTVHCPPSTFDVASGAFMDTAAIMRSLDLVIASDSAVAHLAGALGIPVWVALPFVPDWRWLLQREDSPWYPTMRLFRQTREGDWDGVFERMAQELTIGVRGQARGVRNSEEA